MTNPSALPGPRIVSLIKIDRLKVANQRPHTENCGSYLALGLIIFAEATTDTLQPHRHVAGRPPFLKMGEGRCAIPLLRAGNRQPKSPRANDIRYD
jgi:hypothetical protein